MNFDIRIFEVINGLAGQSKILNTIGIFLADYFQYLLIVVLLFFAFWPKKDRVKNRSMVFVALTSAVISRVIVKSIIIFFIKRPRPFAEYPLTNKLVNVSSFENLQSFPSGHTIFFFSLSLAVYFYNKKLGIVFFASSTLIGIARIFSGVHWPTDILAGAILGLGAAYLVNKIYLKFKNKLDSIIAIPFKIINIE